MLLSVPFFFVKFVRFVRRADIFLVMCCVGLTKRLAISALLVIDDRCTSQTKKHHFAVISLFFFVVCFFFQFIINSGNSNLKLRGFRIESRKLISFLINLFVDM